MGMWKRLRAWLGQDALLESGPGTVETADLEINTIVLDTGYVVRVRGEDLSALALDRGDRVSVVSMKQETGVVWAEDIESQTGLPLESGSDPTQARRS